MAGALTALPWLDRSHWRQSTMPRCSSRSGGYNHESLESPREWFATVGSGTEFGAAAPISAVLRGPSDLAGRWLLGDQQEYDSVDRLIRALRPAGAEVTSVSGSDGAKNYQLQMPALELFGLGVVRSSAILWGRVRDSGGPQAASGPFLEIGSAGGPKAALEIGGQELAFPSFALTVRGALGLEKAGETSSRVVGWISVEVEGELPRLGFFAPPEEVVRAAAKEICAQTVGFVTRKLARDLSDDFRAWQVEVARAEQVSARS